VEGYNLLAPKFDYTPFRTPDSLLNRVVEVVAEQGLFGKALDVCCGTGAAARAFRPAVKEEVVGVDISPGMLAEATRLSLTDGPGVPVRYEYGDACALQYSELFDLAFSFGAFGHILEHDQARFVQGIYRALKPGGRFVFVTGTMPSVTSPIWWMARSYNAATHLRNALINPPFIMFYLHFTWPKVRPVFEAAGFSVNVRENLFDAPFKRALLIEATRPHGPESASIS